MSVHVPVQEHASTKSKMTGNNAAKKFPGLLGGGVSKAPWDSVQLN